MPCTFQLPLKLPGLPPVPPRSPKCQSVPHLALNSAPPAFHFDRLSAGSQLLPSAESCLAKAISDLLS